MIINTGLRTDIPAFYSKWLFNRIEEGYVLVRNPYRRNHVNKYSLDSKYIDCLCFCTKNPKAIVKNADKIADFNQFWFVTVNPYGKDIERNVPHFSEVIKSFKKLDNPSWRYDPIFITDKYDVEFHIKYFEKIASKLEGYTSDCTISFIDLYKKTLRNFPQAREVTLDEQIAIGKEFIEIGLEHGIGIKTCVEGTHLEKYGADCNGCMTQQVLEKAIGNNLKIPKGKYRVRECNCILGTDIGAYNTCLHNCIYCYANANMNLVKRNRKLHNPDSPLLIGELSKDDEVKEVKKCSYIDTQQRLI